jgi:acyl-CoA synthetase (NDP forming)
MSNQSVCEPEQGRNTAPSADLLDLFFRPKSVAVIGASATPGKAGHNVVRHLVEGGYEGDILPINPRGSDIEGFRCFPSVFDLKCPVDLAFISLPASAVVDAVETCAACGVKAVVIGSSGFAELGTVDGRALQRRVAGIAQKAGMRLLGPNTNGLVSTETKLALGFNVCFSEAAGRPGPISFISHSGALFDAVYRRLQQSGLGIGRFVAAGNEADVSMTELLDALADDPKTKVIGLIMEALDDALAFRRASAKAHSNGKRIVALKVGRSSIGVGAALAHSSRLAGGSRAYEAICNDAGIPLVRTIEALTSACAILALAPRNFDATEPVVCVSTSGAGGALLADAAADRVIPLAGSASGEWPRSIAKAIGGIRSRGCIRHPIDLGNLVEWGDLAKVLHGLDTHAHGPLIAYVHNAPHQHFAEGLFSALSAWRNERGRMVMLIAPGWLDGTLTRRYADARIPVIHETPVLFDALKALAIAGAPYTINPPVPERDEARRRDVAKLLEGAGVKRSSVLSQSDSTAVFRRMDIAMAHGHTAGNAVSAVEAARRLGFPVVLKGQVPGVAHKASEGLVELGLCDEEAVFGAFERLRDKCRRWPSFSVLVQSMQSARTETIVAITRDAQLGYFLLVGPGGIDVEKSGETVMIPVPVSRERLEQQVAASGLGRNLADLLPDYGAEAFNRLCDALEGLAALAVEQNDLIEAAEINPMIITAEGRVTGVDALVIVNRGGETE